ncbi:hypothetical protein EDB83DRAFT_2320684 [Lactarius deliciosus]|nr:hypothetical protein EDB83DRAFT_2320684 [Lactarius deliciosus]
MIVAATDYHHSCGSFGWLLVIRSTYTVGINERIAYDIVVRATAEKAPIDTNTCSFVSNAIERGFPGLAPAAICIHERPVKGQIEKGVVEWFLWWRVSAIAASIEDGEHGAPIRLDHHYILDPGCSHSTCGTCTCSFEPKLSPVHAFPLAAVRRWGIQGRCITGASSEVHTPRRRGMRTCTPCTLRFLVFRGLRREGGGSDGLASEGEGRKRGEPTRDCEDEERLQEGADSITWLHAESAG